MTRSNFAGQLGTGFTLMHPARPVHLELIEVDGLSTDPGNEDSFSLIFVAPGHEYLPQATYTLEHDVMGSLPIFLVPVQQDARGIHYQAIFNRMPILRHPQHAM